MLLIIDGYNLLFHEDWHTLGSSLEEQREHLIKELAQYRKRHANVKIIVVFDGRLWVGPYDRLIPASGIEVIYATAEGRADETVVALSHQCSGARVVTADRKVAQQARANQAVVINPTDFLREWRHSANRLADEEKTPPPHSADEIKDWLHYFGLEAEIPIPPSPQPRHKRGKRGKP
jgi:predicted RNA-binding protein with PIN domain